MFISGFSLWCFLGIHTTPTFCRLLGYVGYYPQHRSLCYVVRFLRGQGCLCDTLLCYYTTCKAQSADVNFMKTNERFTGWCKQKRIWGAYFHTIGWYLWCVYVLCICVVPRKSLASVPVFCEEGQNKKLFAMICNWNTEMLYRAKEW